MKSSSGDKLRVEELRLLIQLHSHKYHFLDDPEISYKSLCNCIDLFNTVSSV